RRRRADAGPARRSGARARPVARRSLARAVGREPAAPARPYAGRRPALPGDVRPDPPGRVVGRRPEPRGAGRRRGGRTPHRPGPRPPTRPPRPPPPPPARTRQSVVHSADKFYPAGPTGVSITSRSGPDARRQLSGTPVGLTESRGGTVVAGATGGLVVMSEDG